MRLAYNLDPVRLLTQKPLSVLLRIQRPHVGAAPPEDHVWSETEQLLVPELKLGLAGVTGNPARRPDVRVPQRLAADGAPRVRQRPEADRVEQLVREGTAASEQSVVLEVADSGPAHRELAEFLEATPDDRALVVGPPGGERVDAIQIGEDLRGLGDLVVVEIEGGLRVGQPSVALNRERSSAPERARAGPHRRDSLEVPLASPRSQRGSGYSVNANFHQI